MLGTHRWAVQMKQASALEHPIDDRLREILVVKHTAPHGERLVGGEISFPRRLGPQHIDAIFRHLATEGIMASPT